MGERSMTNYTKGFGEEGKKAEGMPLLQILCESAAVIPSSSRCEHWTDGLHTA